MHVLNLTNAETSFFQDQVRAVERAGVESSTLKVPGREGRGDDRSPVDYLRFLPRVARSLDDSYDVVHANFGLLGPVALAQARRPVVLSLWGTDLYGPFGWVSRACVPFCDAVVVMSEGMAADLNRECEVVPHGVDFERFQPQPRDRARRAVDWDDEAYHVLFPYQPDRDVKNVDLAERVVDAVERMLQRPVRLQVVTGVPHDEFPRYLNAADCLLLSSKREGSPNVVKEAMACNLPVVSTDVGDVRQRLEGVDPSAVCTSEPELVEELASVLDRGERSNGREAVRDLSLEWMGRRLREVYERVLSEDVDRAGEDDLDAERLPAGGR